MRCWLIRRQELSERQGRQNDLGHMLQAFGLGLIPFSAQYLLLRGFYTESQTAKREITMSDRK